MGVIRLTTPNRVLLLLCVMYLILYVDRVNISTAAPLIQADLHLSNTELGFAFSAFAYPYALFQLMGGWIGDSFGARRTLCVALILVCIATALTGMVGGLVSLFCARVALGFGEGSALPTATHAMTRWTPASRWGFAQGITHIFGGLDHLLFLIALMLPAVQTRANGAWQARRDLRSALVQVAWIATAFTVAHSITLALASFGIIRIATEVIEPLIALTVLLSIVIVPWEWSMPPP
jgi:sugar phosphate permease